jgi:hypothetical protein
MRLRGIKTREEANGFLVKYLPVYNRRFRVCPANETDVHVKFPRYFNPDKHLCIRTERTVRNDSTVAHGGRLYLLEEALRAPEGPSVEEDDRSGQPQAKTTGRRRRMKTGHFYFGKNRTFLNWLDMTSTVQLMRKPELCYIYHAIFWLKK